MAFVQPSAEPSLDQDDPWYWGVDKVVATLCDRNGTMLRGVDPLSIPDPVFLEKALRENAVNGPTLLTELSHPALRDDLGLKPLGHRTTLTHIIMDLRRQSPRYLHHLLKNIDYLPSNGAISSIAQSPRFITPLMSPPIQTSLRETPIPSPYGSQSVPSVQNKSMSDHRWQASYEPIKALVQASELSSPETRNLRHSSAGFKTPSRDGGICATKTTDFLAEGRNARSPNSVEDETYQIATAEHAVQDTQPVLALTGRQSETVVIDEHGRKRRRLVLVPVATSDVPREEILCATQNVNNAPIEQTHDPITPTANEQYEPIQSIDTSSAYLEDVYQPGTVVTDFHGRKRLRPTLVTQAGYENGANVAKDSVHVDLKGSTDQLLTPSPDLLVSKTRSPRKNAQHVYPIYLGPESLLVDQIFYGNTIIGQELNLEASCDEKSLSDYVNDPDNFTFCSTRFGNGQRRYVNSRIRHYLHSKKCRRVSRDGQDMVVHVPYPDSLGKKHHPLSVTVFRKSSAGIRASRMNRSSWLRNDVLMPEDETSFGIAQLSNVELPNDNHNGDWDYLKKWQYKSGEEKVLPVYGDSGSENEYDPDTWREMENERGRVTRPLGQSKRKKLDGEVVRMAIEEAAEQIVQRWTFLEKPKLLPKAWKIWKKSRTDGMLRDQINRLTSEIQRLEVRLLNLQKEIMGEEWSSTKEVQKQCKSMEHSIYDREGRKWRVSIVKSKSAPEKIPQFYQKPAKKKPAEDQEQLLEALSSSASVTENQDNDLSDSDDFIDDADINEEFDANEGRALGYHNSGEPSNNQLSDADHTSSESESDNIKLEVEESKVVAAMQKKPPLAGEKHIDSLAKPLLSENMAVIDLTHQSDSSEVEVLVPTQSFPNRTPPLYVSSDEDPFRRARKKPASFKLPPTASSIIEIDSGSSAYSTAEEGAVSSPVSNLPEFLEVQKIRILNPDLLVERKDRKRLIIWQIDHSPPTRRAKITDLIRRNPLEDTKELVWSAFKAYSNAKPKIRGMEDEESDAWMLLAAWYVCWTIPVRINQRLGISLVHLRAAEADHKGFLPFVGFLDQCLSHYDLADTVTPDSSGTTAKKAKRQELREDSDDLPDTTPHKKRKYAVPESQEAVTLRLNAQKRVQERDLRQQNLKQRFQDMGVNKEDSSMVVINTGKLEEQSFIYINPKIGSRMQPHQKEGVQFMWREVVTDHQGCLLAQTMGLGKTMQVITLLVTIAEAAKSSDKNIRNQVPLELHDSRTLILCPPALIDNWWEELLMWTPLPSINNIGELRKVTAAIKLAERLYEIERWKDEGGVLIIGFTTFRDLVANKANKREQKPLSEKQHQMIEDALLNRPTIVVADEAHAIKSVASGINQAISRLKSMNRIALTGSPLSNNLEEYHSLIDWIAPNYLGTRVEFKANYAERIQEGLYQDSTQSQYRQSLKLLEVLKIELQPKVHRADINVLRGTLKEKQEFVIRVPLTSLQEEIYRIYVDSMLSASAEDEPRPATMWAWLSTLRLLCNHPKCFEEKLIAERSPTAAVERHSKKRTGVDVLDEIDELVEAPISEIGISQSMAEKQLAPFKSLTGAHDSISLSNKMEILMNIVQFSKEVNDKVLIFSHSIQTLNYVEHQMKSTQTKYSRIDGKVVPTDRQQITKNFNRGPLEVCLVSTRAGGQGLNLYGANRVVIVDDHFSPTHEEQAIGRAYRIGQKKAVFVYHLTTGGTFEELVYNQSVFKQQLARRVVDKKNPAPRALKKIGDYLFPPKKVKQQDLGRFLGKDLFVLDRILDAHQTYVYYLLWERWVLIWTATH